MFDKALDTVTIDDIRALARDKLPEGQHLDYKQELPGDIPSERVKFLDDVGAFANASGGDIVFGIPEDIDEHGRKMGTPASATGLPAGTSVEEAKQRLLNMIRNGIEPRLTPDVRDVEGDDGPILILRVYRGWNGPYRVRQNEQSRFHVRLGNISHPMDMTEIRTAFARSATLEWRVRQFRDARLAQVIAGETPVALDPVPKLIVHLYPLSAAGLEAGIDVRQIVREKLDFYALASDGGNPRYNIDGYVIPAWRYDLARQTNQCYGYTQVFRDGSVETVNTSLLTYPGSGLILADQVARAIVGRMDTYRISLKALGISPPIFCMVSIIGANGRQVFVQGIQSGLGGGGGMIDRDVVLLPDVAFADEETPTAQVLRPVFDALWQAGNHEECSLYDDQGNWKG